MTHNIIRKPDFLRLVAEDSGFTLKDTYTFFTSFVRVLARCLVSGKEINIFGFGKFYVKDIPEHQGWDGINKIWFTKKGVRRVNFKFASTLTNLVKEFKDINDIEKYINSDEESEEVVE